jgi:hypothetical protein
MRLLPPVLACALLVAVPRLVLAQSMVEMVDHGNFILYLHDKALGAENFSFEARADSMTCLARSYRTEQATGHQLSAGKSVGLTLGRRDWAFRYFQSQEEIRGEKMVHGALMVPNDTVVTIFQETNGGGGAERVVAPPGRLFVLDPGMYSLFDVICIYLHGMTFTTRPLNLLTFGARDTIIEAEVTDLGTEPIRWGARPVRSRKLQISDGTTTFLLWTDPAGKMLRLAHEASGLRVERDPPPVRKRASPAPKPGG